MNIEVLNKMFGSRSELESQQSLVELLEQRLEKVSQTPDNGNSSLIKTGLSFRKPF